MRTRSQLLLELHATRKLLAETLESKHIERKFFLIQLHNLRSEVHNERQGKKLAYKKVNELRSDIAALRLQNKIQNPNAKHDT